MSAAVYRGVLPLSERHIMRGLNNTRAALLRVREMGRNVSRS
jgi:hypothetical protein